ncbi:MAG: hypothetical protein ABI134_27030 [Byssovorax sp.]
MRPPAVDLPAHLDTVEFTGWHGQRIDVWHLYDTLTQRGWKVDTEESNLMNAMSMTWREEGIKVWIHLEKFVCAPPDGEVEALDKVCFYRFDPAEMPSGTMHDKTYDPGDEQQDWYPSHREEWDWLIEHGDPQFDTFELLKPIAFREVPEALLLAAWADLEEAVKLAE